ncbi:hypothetical protein E1263_00530 [Kribbella antibiotica]|uniref:Uncharacterized protein n=1 Tax=Kribbella antibiotica TaxID=190195 RepID=A0A4R4ZW96_9ACTN|nr:hypothetical protein [Kribbella antibiotica]TDD63471.1 hypothetical protein E1263_00530 [Kribbella antibiotica]
MSNLDSKLPELMRQATEDLEPESVDLVERSVAQGTRLRQRRSVLAGTAAGVAVLATVGVVVGTVQHFDGRADGGPMVAAPPTISTPAASTTPTVQTPPPSKAGGPTLATLKSLVQGPGRTLSLPETWGGAQDGFFGAGLVVDDGKGGSRIQVLLERHQGPASCAGEPGCKKRPDGSTIRSSSLIPEYSDDRQQEFGIVYNYVEITRKDGRQISATSYNGVSEKGTKHTRAVPILTVAQLTKLADDQAWKFPAKVTK